MKRIINLMIAFWLLCGVAQAQTRNNTDLYIKLPDASGFEDNSYVPEMNKFVEDMIKDMPIEFQDGNFKVFELGCYSIHEYSKDILLDIVKEQAGSQMVKDAKNSLFIVKRCDKGIYDKVEVYIYLEEKLKDCMVSSFPDWQKTVTDSIEKKITTKWELSGGKIENYHLNIKEGLLHFKKKFVPYLGSCDDNLLLRVPDKFASNFETTSRSASTGLDLKSPFYIFYSGQDKYIKVQFDDNLKAVEQNYGQITYKVKQYMMVVASSNDVFLYFACTEDKNGVPVLPQSKGNGCSYFGLSQFENCDKIMMCNKSLDNNCKLESDVGCILFEKGDTKKYLSAWTTYLKEFSKIQNLTSGKNPFQTLIYNLDKLGEDGAQKYLKTVREPIQTSCNGVCGNLNLATLSPPPADQPCQECIINKLIELMDNYKGDVIKRLVEILPNPKDDKINYKNTEVAELLEILYLRNDK